MLADDLRDLRMALDERGIIFCYSGYVTESILTGIGKALKTKLKLEDADSKTIRNVFGIFVEQVQNIIRYSAEGTPDAPGDGNGSMRYGLVAIGAEDGKFWVTCGNLVRKRDVERLSARLTKLQGMDRDQLKSLYKSKLRGPADPDSKGAGVGFVEIARRSSGIIEFGFVDIDADHAFFCLKGFA